MNEWGFTSSGLLVFLAYRIGVFVVYIDTGNSVPGVPSESRDLADENNKILTEWK